MPRIWMRLRRVTSMAASLQVPFLDLVGDVIAGAPAERRDRKRRILVGVADERRGVGDEKILAVPGLAPLVEHAALGVVAHLGGADLVDDFAATRNRRA